MDVSWNLKPTAHITGSKVETTDGVYKKCILFINIRLYLINRLRICDSKMMILI